MSLLSSEVRRARPLLGTIVELRASDARRDMLLRGVQAAFRQLERVHALMSFHDPSSELNRLNREAHRRTVAVSSETYAVLALAREIAAASGGLFDVSVAPQLVRWGYLPSFGGAASCRGTTADIELSSGRRVRFARPLLVDLGGIAKGYAVDRAVEALRDAGVVRGVVNAGGDLRVFGPCAETVHVRHPRRPGMLLPLAALRDGAMATSATYFSRRRVRGRQVSPVVHRADGRPCLRAFSASVVAPTCAVADALAKVVLLGGKDAFPMLDTFSASALILTPNGRVLVSEPARAA